MLSILSGCMTWPFQLLKSVIRRVLFDLLLASKEGWQPLSYLEPDRDTPSVIGAETSSTLDLCDANFHIQIYKGHRNFLQFFFQVSAYTVTKVFMS